ncbi:MAG: type II toxin-antitoxin system YafQ family toxin [Hyphomicrobiales bacterium]|nr:type II toxin-antitoxin system YafQ family toxin [Hyphomicrobiales bacterium]
MRGRHLETLEADLTCVLGTLAADSPLPEKHRDHPLSGIWSGFRDCHVKPDLILVYEKPNADTLWLVRLGSHGELGLLDSQA